MPHLPKSYESELERFKERIVDHQMDIIRDDGLYRHLRFKKPKTFCEHFDIVTWPGRLCYTGDMGTYVFTRLSDMFQFFRGNPDNYRIDYRYWAEKLEAVDKVSLVSSFSADCFHEQIKTCFNDWAEGQDDANFIAQTWERVTEDVLPYADEGESAAYRAAFEFDTSIAEAGSHRQSNRSVFSEFWEYDCREYSFHYLWCCWALRWAINVYDNRCAYT